eukprot:Hpha_TRINITY_DN29669_c0_g1::TRINITY_DN29669_c0_g1_i1::g.165255::m.165255
MAIAINCLHRTSLFRELQLNSTLQLRREDHVSGGARLLSQKTVSATGEHQLKTIRLRRRRKVPKGQQRRVKPCIMPQSPPLSPPIGVTSEDNSLWSEPQPLNHKRRGGRETAHVSRQTTLDVLSLGGRRRVLYQKARRVLICVVAVVRLLRSLREPLTRHELRRLKEWHEHQGVGLHTFAETRNFLAEHGLNMSEDELEGRMRQAQFRGFGDGRRLPFEALKCVFAIEKRQFSLSRARDGLDEAFRYLGDGGSPSADLVNTCLKTCQQVGVNVEHQLHHVRKLASPDVGYGDFVALVEGSSTGGGGPSRVGGEVSRQKPSGMSADLVVPGAYPAVDGSGGSTLSNTFTPGSGVTPGAIVDILSSNRKSRIARPVTVTDENHARHAADIRLLRKRQELMTKFVNDPTSSSDGGRSKTTRGKARWMLAREVTSLASNFGDAPASGLSGGLLGAARSLMSGESTRSPSPFSIKRLLAMKEQEVVEQTPEPQVCLPIPSPSPAAVSAIAPPPAPKGGWVAAATLPP